MSILYDRTVSQIILIKNNMSDEELYKKCKEYGQNARMWQRQFAALLPEVYRRRLYKKKGYCSIYEFASKLAGMSGSAVDAVLRVHERLKDKPELISLLAEKGWGKLKIISSIATKETQKFWAEKVEEMSSSTLQKFVQEMGRLPKDQNIEDLGINSSNPRSVSQKSTLSFKLDSETESRLRVFRQKLEKEKGEPLDWNTTIKKLLEIAEKKKKNKTITNQNSFEAKNRYIPVAVRSALEEKYHGKCAYPGCKYPSEIFHHTKRFSLVPEHDPSYIAPLCKNHERLAHLGLIENEEKDPKTWKIRIYPDMQSVKHIIDQKVNKYYNSG
jgi:hypothetical protein